MHTDDWLIGYWLKGWRVLGLAGLRVGRSVAYCACLPVGAHLRFLIVFVHLNQNVPMAYLL
ncbi:MAG: hypothetical protein KAJ14_03070 [Candidatus Omnitrophica bacterium]|nr:hypothetical protein [Candidatus Omnitrophota bacterium]